MSWDDIDFLRAENSELRDYHDACIKELYRLLDIDDSDEEYRFKWVALAVANQGRQVREYKEALELLLRTYPEDVGVNSIIREVLNKEFR